MLQNASQVTKYLRISQSSFGISLGLLDILSLSKPKAASSKLVMALRWLLSLGSFVAASSDAPEVAAPAGRLRGISDGEVCDWSRFFSSLFNHVTWQILRFDHVSLGGHPVAAGPHVSRHSLCGSSCWSTALASAGATEALARGSCLRLLVSAKKAWWFFRMYFLQRQWKQVIVAVFIFENVSRYLISNHTFISTTQSNLNRSQQKILKLNIISLASRMRGDASSYGSFCLQMRQVHWCIECWVESHEQPRWFCKSPAQPKRSDGICTEHHTATVRKIIAGNIEGDWLLSKSTSTDNDI